MMTTRRSFVQKAMEERFASALHELDELKKDRYRNIRTYHSAFDSEYYQQRSIGNTAGREQVTPALNKFEDTLNKMLLHYKHQLPSFISNVITQVVERHLIDGMEEIFETTAHSLPDATLKTLMEEDFATQAERKEIKDQRDVLQEGLVICREIAQRPDLGPYEYRDPKLAGPDMDARIARRAIPEFGGGNDPFSSNRSSRSSAYQYQPSVGKFDSAPPHHEYVDPAVNLKTPTSAEEEDEELQRALEESRKQAHRELTPSLPSRPAPTPGDDTRYSASSRRRNQGLGGLFGRN